MNILKKFNWQMKKKSSQEPQILHCKNFKHLKFYMNRPVKTIKWSKLIMNYRYVSK